MAYMRNGRGRLRNGRSDQDVGYRYGSTGSLGISHTGGRDPLKLSKDEIIGLAVALLCAAALVGIATYAHAENSGPSSWIEALGGDFDSFVQGLEEHTENYLGTPYSSGGRLGGPGVGMDCSSFPAFAAYYEAGNPAIVGSGLKLAASYAGVSNAVLGAPSTLGWVRWAESIGLPISYYGSTYDVLERADLHKGDLLIGSSNSSFDPGVGGASSNNHAMIYWGDEENPDLIFHQTTSAFSSGWQAGSQCQISSLTGQSWVTHVALIPGGSSKPPTTGYLLLHAISANEGLTTGNAMYSLEGASFGVYSDEGLSNEVATLWTNADGWSDTVELEQGTYFLKQTGTAPGYTLIDEVKTAEVVVGEADAPAQVDVQLTPQTASSAVLAKVASSETGEAQGEASLDGAQVLVTYFDSLDTSVTSWWTPKASWTLKTDELGETGLLQAAADPETYLASDSPHYYDASGAACLPLGTYVIQQQQAPAGYELSDTTPYTCQVMPSEGSLEAQGFEAPTMANQVIRGDLQFIKANQRTAQRQAGIAFRITSTTTGETHLAVTDENGHLSTAAADHPHSNAPNQNDLAYAARNLVDSTQLSSQKGIYFTGRTDTILDPVDDNGALPYDTYTIEELPCEGNGGLGLVIFEAVIRTNGVVDLGTVDSAPEEEPEATASSAIRPMSTSSLTPLLASEDGAAETDLATTQLTDKAALLSEDNEDPNAGSSDPDNEASSESTDSTNDTSDPNDESADTQETDPETSDDEAVDSSSGDAEESNDSNTNADNEQTSSDASSEEAGSDDAAPEIESEEGDESVNPDDTTTKTIVPTASPNTEDSVQDERATTDSGTGSGTTTSTPSSPTQTTTVAKRAATTSSSEAIPQTGRTPLVLGVVIIGLILGAIALVFYLRKPKKLGGSKGDVW